MTSDSIKPWLCQDCRTWWGVRGRIRIRSRSAEPQGYFLYQHLFFSPSKMPCTFRSIHHENSPSNTRQPLEPTRAFPVERTLNSWRSREGSGARRAKRDHIPPSSLPVSNPRFSQGRGSRELEIEWTKKIKLVASDWFILFKSSLFKL